MSTIWAGYRFNLHSAPRPGLQVEGTMTQIQPCKCIPLYHICTSHIHFCMPSYVLNITGKKTKKKHLRCFSNAVLGILFGDSVSFRSGSSVLGLRVHHSVRYNYEKLIPGRPVWHFIHDVSYGYLIHSSLTVHPHTYKSTHILQTQNFLHIHIPACWQLHEFGNRLGSFVPLVNNWIGLSQMHVH